MRRGITVVMMVLLVVISTIPCAAGTRNASMQPSLSFNGNTANCSVAVVENDMSDHIVVVMKLWQGSNCVSTWQGEGYGYIHMQESTTVSYEKSYTLTVEETVNGTTKPKVSVSGVCNR